MSETGHHNPEAMWLPPEGFQADKLLDKNLWDADEIDEKVQRSLLPPVGVIVEPMVCTITATDTPYHTAGPFVFREADGKDMGVYYDTASRFSVTCIRSTVSGCDIVADFRRITGSGLTHAYVVLQRGTVLISNLNYKNKPIFGTSFGPYTVSVTGDFTMSGSTVDHWDGGEWRVMSWGRPGTWPFPITPTTDLQAKNLVMHYDTTLGNAILPAPGPGNLGGGTLNSTMIYQPFQQTNGSVATNGYICGLRMGGASTSTDSAIGLEGFEVSAYLAGHTEMLSTVLEQADAFHVYPWHRHDPNTGAPIQSCGPASGLYTPSQYHNSSAGMFCIQPGSGTCIAVTITNTTAASITMPIGTVANAVNPVDTIANVTYTFQGSSVTIPANGSATLATLESGGPNAYFPWAGGIALSSNAPAGLTVTWVVPPSPANNTGSGAEGISCTEPEVNHNPNGGFLTFLLTGDPYHLATLQGKACAIRAIGLTCWPIAATGVQFCTAPINGFQQIGSARAFAWMTRDIAEATIATPTSGLPSWLLPQAPFLASLTEILNALNYNTAHPLQTMGNIMKFVTVRSGNTAGCNSNYEDYLLNALSRCYLADPTNWLPFILDYVQNITQGRLNPTSGWCITVPQWYYGIVFNTATSWATAYSLLSNSPNYNYASNPGVGLQGQCPATLTFSNPTPPYPNINGSDSTWLYSGMCRMQQLGIASQAPGWHAAAANFVPQIHSYLATAGGGTRVPPGWSVNWSFCLDSTLGAPTS